MIRASGQKWPNIVLRRINIFHLPNESSRESLGYISGFSYNDVPFDMFIIYDATVCVCVRGRKERDLCIFIGNIFDSSFRLE